MKFCENCSEEIGTKDGDNLCATCEQAEGDKKRLTAQRRKLNRKAREDALRSCGLVKVRGTLGGTYWE
jgi:alpha-D-ribose 1-methylphosphonate 5-triphosphate synthase subunit PhnG